MDLNSIIAGHCTDGAYYAGCGLLGAVVAIGVALANLCGC